MFLPLIRSGCIKVDLMDGSTGRRIPPLIMGHEASGVVAEVGSDVKSIQPGERVTFDAVGIDASFKTAIGSLRKGGALTLIGNLFPDINLPLQTVVTGEITLNGSCASRGEYPTCLNMIAEGMVKVDPFITAVAPLAEGAEWFRRLYQKEKGLLKVILEP